MRIALAAGLLGICACSATRGQESPAERQPIARSLLGALLYAPPIPAERAAALEADLEAARAAYAADPESAEAAVWCGRRLAYLSRYEEAIEVYTAGLEHHPSSAALLRHRGHRLITLRRLRPAILDLERARVLLLGAPDAVEQDGQPNEHGVPRSTLKTNVWYHLGLAYFLEGNYPMALRTYREGLELARVNDDMFTATAYWLYLTLRRAGHRREAVDLLEAISADMEILENHAYHRLLLLYRGDLALEDLATAGADGVEDATIGYGLASYHLHRGEGEAAAQALRSVVAGEAWAAFGHLAAEADLVRLGPFLPGATPAAEGGLDRAAGAARAPTGPD